MKRSLRRAMLVVAVVVGAGLASPARAQQATLAGSWTASALTETVTIKSWVDECGAKPKSSSVPGGSSKVSVVGDELVFSGPQPFRTDVCWDMVSAKRVSHSATPAIRSWKTRCESAPGDPRKASITTFVRALDDDTIVLTESATYSSTMSSGNCTAQVDRTRTYKIVAREGAAPPASTSAPAASSTVAPAPSPSPAPTPAPTPLPACDAPGDPATLEVKPRKKILRPGEQFEFKARLLDAKGCEAAGKTTFRLAPESASLSTIVLESNGKVKVRADAEPLVAVLVVEGAGKSAKVELEIVTDQKYAELLAAGQGDAALDDQALSIVVSNEGSNAASTTVHDPKLEEGKRKRFAYLAIAGGTCALLALGALVLWRRGNAEAARVARRAAKRAPLEPARAHAPPPTPRPIAPPAAQPLANAPVVAPPISPAVVAPAASAAVRTCSRCGQTPPDEAEFCPNDGTPLAKSSGPPAASAPARAVGAQGRICPVCGRRYEREAAFCSKDGVELVPLN